MQRGKILVLGVVILSVLLISCSTKPMPEATNTTTTPRERALLRLVFCQYVIQMVEGKNTDKPFEWIEKEALSKRASDYEVVYAVLALALRPKDKVEGIALKVLQKSPDGMCRHYAALVLAYFGNEIVAEQLARTALGKDESLMTQSEFEQGEAALGLLVLGKKLPKGFSFRNTIFKDLEVFVEN